MSGEYINAETIKDYWEQLKVIYRQKSHDWQDITREEYEKLEHSEREDSDNHLNMERLGKETQVIDLCHYKFLPDRVAAYHITIMHKNGSTEEHFFRITLEENFQ